MILHTFNSVFKKDLPSASTKSKVLTKFLNLTGQYEMGECVRSGFCNFMHLKPISRELRRELYGRHGAQSGLGNHGRNKDGGERRRSRSRDRERKRSRSRERRRDRSRDRGDRSGRY